MTSSAYDVAALAARQEISDVIHRYCHAIDRRRWWLMETVFHEDATYKFTAIEGGWRHFVAEARRLVDPLAVTHHQVSNILVALDGDVAHTETYLTAYHLVPADYPTDLAFPGTGQAYEVVTGGRYVDRFERRNGVWKIAHRTGLFDWRRDQPLADGGLSEAPADWRGQHGDLDPSRSVAARWRSPAAAEA